MSPLVVWVCLVLLLTDKLDGASTGNVKAFDPSTLVKGNPFAILSYISEHMPPQQIPSNETIKNCPNLWSQTQKEFEEKEETGILGSIPKLQELCPEKKEDQTVCKGAVWISTYVCTASQGGKHLPAVKDFKNLTNGYGLCNALVGNSNLTLKLCAIVETSLKSFANMPELKKKLEQSCSLPSSGIQDICVNYCSNDNLPLCKTILQSLRTIVLWEEEKEKAQSEVINNSETADSTSDTVKAASSSSTTELPPSLAKQVPSNGTNITVLDTNQMPATPKITQSSIILSSVTNKTIDGQITTTISEKDSIGKTEPKSPSTATSTRVTTVVPDTTLGPDYDDLDGAERPPVKLPGEEEPQLDDDDAMDQQAMDEDDADKGMDKPVDTIPEETRKPAQSNDPSELDSDPINTHFLFYFIVFVVLSVSGYLIYMRRKYLIALVVEGRSSGSNRRRSNSRDRPSSGSYRKLVNNLEEAITSNSVKNSNVIY